MCKEGFLLTWGACTNGFSIQSCILPAPFTSYWRDLTENRPDFLKSPSLDMESKTTGDFQEPHSIHASSCHGMWLLLSCRSHFLVINNVLIRGQHIAAMFSVGRRVGWALSFFGHPSIHSDCFWPDITGWLAVGTRKCLDRGCSEVIET